MTDALAHLRFRWREPNASWNFSAQGVWEVYSCLPRAIATPDRASVFARPWWDMPTSRQPGRQNSVSTYQFHMWTEHGVDAQRFWVLQGPWGGTPATYTEREARILDAAGMVSEPLPFGMMPPCDFDEQSVAGILSRDRLLHFGNDVDALVKSNSADAQLAVTADAERAFRDRFLDHWYERMAPQAEFLKTYLGTTEADTTMRRATPEENNNLAVWKEQFVETGHVPGSTPVMTRQVAVR